MTPSKPTPCGEVGDRVIWSPAKRNSTISDVEDILCFEMEAAGIATEFPIVVIRSVSDHADSHMNDSCEHDVATTAATSAKELFSYITPEQSVGDEASSAALD